MISGPRKQNSVIADCAENGGNQVQGSREMKRAEYTRLVDFSQRPLLFSIYCIQYNVVEMPPPESQSWTVIIEEQKNKRLKGMGSGLRGIFIVL